MSGSIVDRRATKAGREIANKMSTFSQRLVSKMQSVEKVEQTFSTFLKREAYSRLHAYCVSYSVLCRLFRVNQSA